MLPRIGLVAVVVTWLSACSSLLPSEKEATASPWQSYRDAQLTFDKIVPGHTHEVELAAFHLDPASNPNLWRWAAAQPSRPAWLTVTPLGTPVDPDVKIT